MDRTSYSPDPDRLIACLRAEPATIVAVFNEHPNLRGIANNSAQHRLRMQHTYGKDIDAALMDQATAEAFTATMLLVMLYSNQERILLVKTFGDVLLSESATSFAPVGRSLINSVTHEQLPTLVRAQMDTHLLCCYANQMRDPREYVRELASELIREKEYIDQAVTSVMQHHRYVGKTFH